MYKIPTKARETYGSHLDFLNEELLKAPDKINVLEFGCGRFSTITFLNHKKIKEVFSIEMQDENYLNELIKEIKSKRWSYGFAETFDIAEMYAMNYIRGQRPHIALVDGHMDTRPECVNLCVSMKVPVIVAHDFQYPGYGWERIDQGNYEKVIRTRPDGQQTAFFYLKP